MRMHSIYCHLVMNLTQYLAQHSINSKGRLFRHQTVHDLRDLLEFPSNFRDVAISPPEMCTPDDTSFSAK